ncbi:MAG: phosphoribosylamine--glycine ligase [Candidatus Thermoplasmatota archaeon]|nr:phosphoribosylamine--glycine ligase [Candidatus Thermoplasmatota archaeon]
MKILLVGGGAREHALALALTKNPDNELYAVAHNMNPGIARIAKEFLLEKETNGKKIAEWAKSKGVKMAIVGPDPALEAGVTDDLADAGIDCASPSKKAAEIETSKQFMRKLMAKYKIPGSIRCEVFDNAREARKYIDQLGFVAVKPIGLTGGKGVQVSGDHFKDTDGAMEYVKEVLSKGIGGSKVLIEEKLEGEEFSLQAFSDGKDIYPMPAVQDHKRLLDGDKGPNTGGMGSYSQEDGLLPFLGRSDYEDAACILQKIIEALDEDGRTYIGPIYGQFMLTANGPKVIEVNARFGDPEAMNVLSLLRSDYADICKAMISGKLSRVSIQFSHKASVCKYVVPEGYGIKPMEDQEIKVDEKTIAETGARIFYASVNEKDGKVYTTRSRAIGILAMDDSISEANKTCEKALKCISGKIFVRHDIATKELLDKRVKHMKEIRC